MAAKAGKYKIKNSRACPRLKASYLIKYRVIDESGHERIRTANTKDLSPRGLRFWTDEPVPEGALLRLEVLLPSRDRSVRAFGRVIKVRPAMKLPPRRVLSLHPKGGIQTPPAAGEGFLGSFGPVGPEDEVAETSRPLNYVHVGFLEISREDHQAIVDLMAGILGDVDVKFVFDLGDHFTREIKETVKA